jgi:hypothetical protein
MNYYDDQVLNSQAVSVLSEVVEKLGEGGINITFIKGTWGHIITVEEGGYSRNVLCVELGSRRSTRDPVHLIYKFPTLRLYNCGNEVASQLRGDSKDLVEKIVTKITDRIVAIRKDTEATTKRKELHDESQKKLESLHAAYPQFSKHIHLGSRGLVIEFSFLSVEKAHEILTALENHGVVIS